MEILTLLNQGGPVMYILLALSVISLAIVIFKGVQFYKLKVGKANYLEHVIMLIKQGKDKEALSNLSKINHPSAQVVATSLISTLNSGLGEEDVRAEIQRAGTEKLRELEEWLRGLSVIAQLSPLLGLLGTVIGMIAAFKVIEGAGSSVNPSLLAGGIWEALLTTAFGLGIAIPTLAAYSYFEGKVDDVKAVMSEGVSRVLVTVKNRSKESK